MSFFNTNCVYFLASSLLFQTVSCSLKQGLQRLEGMASAELEGVVEKDEKNL